MPQNEIDYSQIEKRNVLARRDFLKASAAAVLALSGADKAFGSDLEGKIKNPDRPDSTSQDNEKSHEKESLDQYVNLATIPEEKLKEISSFSQSYGFNEIYGIRGTVEKLDDPIIKGNDRVKFYERDVYLNIGEGEYRIRLRADSIDNKSLQKLEEGIENNLKPGKKAKLAFFYDGRDKVEGSTQNWAVLYDSWTMGDKRATIYTRKPADSDVLELRVYRFEPGMRIFPSQNQWNRAFRK